MMRNLISVLLVVFLTTGSAFAQKAPTGEKEETKKTVAMSQDVYEALQEAQEMATEKRYADVHKRLGKMLEKRGLSAYEIAQIHNLNAYTYYQEENFGSAIRSYEQLLAQGDDLPEALIQSTLKTMAQLYFTEEKYDEALSTTRRLMAMLEEPSADIYMLVGQIYFQKGDYDSALQPIQTAIDMYQAQGRQPKENWLLLLRVIHYEKKDYPKMVTVLKELLRYYPKDSYVMTLAAAYSELGETKKQLALTESLYESGYITASNHLVNLANLYLMHETPYKAAALLEKELASGRVESTTRNLRLLSQAWYQAREDKKAIPPLRQAAELSGDGELYVRLAQSHINLEQWDPAIDAVREGLRLGGVSRVDTANIMLGMALLNKKRLRDAREAFRVAMRADERSERVARQWIAHVDTEIERAQTLSQEIKTRAPREIDEMLQDAAGP